MSSEALSTSSHTNDNTSKVSEKPIAFKEVTYTKESPDFKKVLSHYKGLWMKSRESQESIDQFQSYIK